jgi:hypothetical protein
MGKRVMFPQSTWQIRQTVITQLRQAKVRSFGGVGLGDSLGKSPHEEE